MSQSQGSADGHEVLLAPAPFRFTPLDPTSATAPQAAARPGHDPLGSGPLDLAGGDPAGWFDLVAVAAVGAATAEPGVLGLWATWREPFEPTDGSEAVRVFLVEVDEEISPAVMTVRIQQAVRSIGESSSRVEVFGADTRLTDYQRGILGGGALLWTAHPGSVPKVVPVFDGVDPETGPRFDAGHVRLAAAERTVVAAYLYGAEVVMHTTATMIDVMNPDRGEVVPLSFRTDGEYIWPEAVAYYVDQHGLAPYGPLLEAIRSAGYQPSRPTGVALFRAENALFATD
jgi:hypothetical protein